MVRHFLTELAYSVTVIDSGKHTMGINIDCAQFLVAAKKAGARFTDTLTLGRQFLFVPRPRLQACLAPLQASLPPGKTAWADGLFKALGAEKLDFMDNSPYEGATVIQDLNRPVPAALHGAYDFVFDGGTLEHVYDFPTAVENCMQLCRVGGHVCLWTPANNECGHGFYQFSPELFFRLFGPKNGFQIRSVVFAEQRPFSSRWFEVRDPAEINARVCCVNRHPVFLMVLARKERTIDPGSWSVFQTDYVEAWGASDRTAPRPDRPVSAAGPGLKTVLRKGLAALPRNLAGRLLNLYSTYFVRRLWNSAFFRRVDPATYAINQP